MTCESKDYAGHLGLAGFSGTLLKNHFTLYQGYVTNTNRLLDPLDQMAGDGNASAPEFAELKRRPGREFDGMRLHGLYFGNLGGEAPLKAGGRLAKALSAQFGSLQAREKEFRASGPMRGAGWVVLYGGPVSGHPANFWINEHDTAAHPAGCVPLPVMDVFEHAFMLDCGLKRADHIEAFFKAVLWSGVEARLKGTSQPRLPGFASLR